ncbi:hypothetical protein GCM10007067_12580 [Lysobacter bugurensis]|uniref:Uncharacterized protein n=2 Tax=Cognatilysobacter bugurensis TaxID=543356 RepID=A0A918W7D2_9GAMM|nr:hypothetical protein GCM10007067_12580 [Lysobacter bugurensis]
MQQEAELVLEAVTEFMRYIRLYVRDWEEAYLRFTVSEESSGIAVTYLAGHEAHFVDSDDEHEIEVMSLLSNCLAELQRKLGFKVALLIVRPSNDFKVLYEHRDSSRWEITKLDGRSGIPEGYLRRSW